MEVLQEGYLERCVSDSSSKKQYKKYYFVFKRELNSGSKTLEYFKDSNWKKTDPKGVCNVYSGYSVNIILQTKKKFLFEVVTIDKTHELLTSSISTGTNWVQVLNEGLYIQTYNVTLINYPPSAQSFVINMPPDSELKISESSVSLVGYGCPSVTWRFSAIRKYKLHNACLVLEVGTRAMTGQGEFRFDAVDCKKIYEVLDKAVKQRIKLKGITSNNNTVLSTSHEKDSHVPSSKLLDNALANNVSSNSNFTSNKKNFNKLRSQSQYSPRNTPSPDENEYSHLSSIQKAVSQKTQGEENTYDELFTSNRFTKQRRSDPTLHTPQFLETKKKLTGNSVLLKAKPIMESQEDYVQMNSSEEIKVTPPMTRPKPPPRVKPKDQISTEAIYDNDIETTEDSKGRPNQFPVPLEAVHECNTYDSLAHTISPSKENTYDSLASTSPTKHISATTSEYNSLFENKHSVCKTDDKVAQVTENTYGNVVEKKKVIQKPPRKTALLPQQSFNNKTPLKPVRPAPVAPKKQPLYDAPTPTNDDEESYERYNQVGDVIPGEYAESSVLEDDDGYMEVPRGNPIPADEGIYQTPRE